MAGDTAALIRHLDSDNADIAKHGRRHRAAVGDPPRGRCAQARPGNGVRLEHAVELFDAPTPEAT
jgi:hypothetical protein